MTPGIVALVAGAAAMRLTTESYIPLMQGTLSIRVHMSTTGQYQITVNEEVVSSGANPFAGGTVRPTRAVSWQTSEESQTLSVEARLVPFEGPPMTSNSVVRLCDGGTAMSPICTCKFHARIARTVGGPIVLEANQTDCQQSETLKLLGGLCHGDRICLRCTLCFSSTHENLAKAALSP